MSSPESVFGSSHRHCRVCACWSDVTAGVTSHGLSLFLPLTQMCSGDEIQHQLIFVNWISVGAMVTV